MKFRVECKPAFDYARKPHRVEIIEKGAKFITDELSMCVATDVTLTEGDNGMVPFGQNSNSKKKNPRTLPSMN
jgi:hypothetical protein